MIKLNLGCCDNLLPANEGWINVDIFEVPRSPDAMFQLADLKQRWPWDDGSVDYIRAWDIIEHLPDKIHTMNEAWRVLRAGGEFDIVVPTTDGRGAWQDPQHCSFWNRNSFWYYTESNINRQRFAAAYGITARFRVVREKFTRDPEFVTKLAITLEAIK